MRKISIFLIGICLISITSLLSGCVDVPEEITQFSIISFNADPNIINEGEYANLSWVVLSGSSVTIDNGIGDVALTGRRIIQPTRTTTYTLTATNASTSKIATVMIYVSSPEPPIQTPNIYCATDSTTNKIIVTMVDTDIKWDDIVITTDSAVTWRINYNGGTTALPNNSYPRNSAVEVIAGDYIFLSGTGLGNVRVILRYVPTNSLLGVWTVNV